MFLAQGVRWISWLNSSKLILFIWIKCIFFIAANKSDWLNEWRTNRFMEEASIYCYLALLLWWALSLRPPTRSNLYILYLLDISMDTLFFLNSEAVSIINCVCPLVRPVLTLSIFESNPITKLLMAIIWNFHKTNTNYMKLLCNCWKYFCVLCRLSIFKIIFLPVRLLVSFVCLFVAVLWTLCHGL